MCVLSVFSPVQLLATLISLNLLFTWASLVPQTVKNLPAMQETWVRSLGWEELLEEGMAIHFNILAFGIPRTEQPGRLQSMRSQPNFP